MLQIAGSVVRTDVFFPSAVLKRGVSSLTSHALVRLDASGADFRLGTEGLPVIGTENAPTRLSRSIQAKPGPIVHFGPVRPDDDMMALLAQIPQETGRWTSFEVSFASGVVDRFTLRLDGGAYDINCGTVLSAIWPTLREDCLVEISGLGAGTDAMLWTISQNLKAAVLILDAAGRVVQANAAGTDVLKHGRVLYQTHDGLCCGDAAKTRALRRSIRECLAQKPGADTEMILFLERAGDLGRVPLSLSRFNGNAGVPLVVAVLPQKPDAKRIEMMAQKMGLTPSEARVAALMQLGLPNREAASMAGFKEQTFNTYSKRVLAKLNMSCRAEMAQMLTWQAGWGRSE